MTDYNFKAHRKACIDKAISDGYFDTANDARRYDLCDDGQFHLKADQFHWFATHINLDDYEEVS